MESPSTEIIIKLTRIDQNHSKNEGDDWLDNDDRHLLETELLQTPSPPMQAALEKLNNSHSQSKQNHHADTLEFSVTNGGVYLRTQENLSALRNGDTVILPELIYQVEIIQKETSDVLLHQDGEDDSWQTLSGPVHNFVVPIIPASENISDPLNFLQGHAGTQHQTEDYSIIPSYSGSPSSPPQHSMSIDAAWPRAYQEQAKESDSESQQGGNVLQDLGINNAASIMAAVENKPMISFEEESPLDSLDGLSPIDEISRASPALHGEKLTLADKLTQIMKIIFKENRK